MLRQGARPERRRGVRWRQWPATYRQRRRHGAGSGPPRPPPQQQQQRRRQEPADPLAASLGQSSAPWRGACAEIRAAAAGPDPGVVERLPPPLLVLLLPPPPLLALVLQPQPQPLVLVLQLQPLVLQPLLPAGPSLGLPLPHGPCGAASRLHPRSAAAAAAQAGPRGPEATGRLALARR